MYPYIYDSGRKINVDYSSGKSTFLLTFLINSFLHKLEKKRNVQTITENIRYKSTFKRNNRDL